MKWLSFMLKLKKQAVLNADVCHAVFLLNSESKIVEYRVEIELSVEAFMSMCLPLAILETVGCDTPVFWDTSF